MIILKLTWDLDAEEELRLSYRAAKERILKMSIYDNSSGKEVAAAITAFMDYSGTVQYSAVQCSTVLYSTEKCSTLQYIALCFTVS